jgi:hypothetical protein
MIIIWSKSVLGYLEADSFSETIKVIFRSRMNIAFDSKFIEYRV